MSDAYKKKALAYVKDVLKRSGLNATQLAKAIDVSPSTLTRPINSPEHPHSISGRTLEKIAEFMGENLPLSLNPNKRTVPVVSYVGAGAEVFPFDEVFEEIDAPPGAPKESFAVIIQGDSMYPMFFDGDHLVVEWIDDPRDLIGDRSAIVELKDGRRLVKQMTAGAQLNTFTLLSHNSPAIPNVRVKRAARIIWHRLGRT